MADVRAAVRASLRGAGASPETLLIALGAGVLRQRDVFRLAGARGDVHGHVMSFIECRVGEAVYARGDVHGHVISFVECRVGEAVYPGMLRQQWPGCMLSNLLAGTVVAVVHSPPPLH